MKKIDSLIYKVKHGLIENKEKLIYVMIGYDKPNNVSCTVWNGIPGQARTIEFDCSTREEALAKIEETVKEYPNRRKINGIDLDENTAFLIDIDTDCSEDW